MNYLLIVENTLTNEKTKVAKFMTQGDLFITMTALQNAAPKHLIYKFENLKK